MSPSAETYLKCALRELDACTIPGVGTFRKEYQPAAPRPTDSPEGLTASEGLAPPAAILVFEEGQTQGGAAPILLADFLFTRFGLSETEAMRSMSEIKIEMVWALETRKKCEVADIGFLIRTAEGKTVFLPNQPNDTLGLSYGLQPVAVPTPIEPLVPVPASPVMQPPLGVAPSTIPATMPPSRKSAPVLAGIFSLPNVRVGLLILFLMAFTGFALYKAISVPDRDIEQYAGVRKPFPETDSEDGDKLFGRSRKLPEPANEQQATEKPSRPAPAQKETPAPLATASRPAAGDAAAAGPGGMQTRGIDEDPRALARTMRGGDVSQEEYGIVGDLESLAQALGGATNQTARVGATRVEETPGGTTLSRGIGENNAYSAPRVATHFHLIAGSFTTLDKAQEFVNEARGWGTSPVILFPIPGESMTYRVSLYHGATKPEVSAFSDQLKKQGRKTGWIWEQ